MSLKRLSKTIWRRNKTDWLGVLPAELWLSVIHELSIGSLLALARTCKGFTKVCLHELGHRKYVLLHEMRESEHADRRLVICPDCVDWHRRPGKWKTRCKDIMWGISPRLANYKIGPKRCPQREFKARLTFDTDDIDFWRLHLTARAWRIAPEYGRRIEWLRSIHVGNYWTGSTSAAIVDDRLLIKAEHYRLLAPKHDRRDDKAFRHAPGCKHLQASGALGDMAKRFRFLHENDMYSEDQEAIFRCRACPTEYRIEIGNVSEFQDRAADIQFERAKNAKTADRSKFKMVRILWYIDVGLCQSPWEKEWLALSRPINPRFARYTSFDMSEFPTIESRFEHDLSFSHAYDFHIPQEI